jgi:hypothetical protein
MRFSFIAILNLAMAFIFIYCLEHYINTSLKDVIKVACSMTLRVTHFLFVRFTFVTTVSMHFAVFWNVTSCIFVDTSLQGVT